jgi:Tfp pilus assembly protein PilO
MSEIVIGGRAVPALYVGVVVALLGLGYAGYTGFMAEESLSARNDALTAKENGIVEKEGQAKELAERTKQIDTIKAEIQDLEHAVTLLREKIPSEAQVPVLHYHIERMAKSSQGTMNSYQPGALRGFGQADGAAGGAPDAKPAGAPGTQDIMELPVTIQCTATYPEVIKFLGSVSNYERKLSVSNLKISPGAGGEVAKTGKEAIVFKNALNVEFTLAAYILKAGGAQP